MNLSGLTRASLIPLLVVGQFACAHLAFSEPEQRSIGAKPLLKMINKAGDKAPGAAKPIGEDHLPANKSKQADQAKKSLGKPTSQPARINKAQELIPPPPAFQPSYLINSGSIGLPMQLDLMSKEMLSQRLKDVLRQLADAKSQLTDKTGEAKEEKERALRFQSLYEEGVVSRHELEAAAKEALQSEKDLSRFQENVTELKNEKKSLGERLKPAQKQTAQAKKSQHRIRHQAIGAKP